MEHQTSGTLLLCAGLLFAAGSLVADELTYLVPGLSDAERVELRDKRELVRFTDAAPEFALLPMTALAFPIRARFQGYAPTVTDEALFLLPMPDVAPGTNTADFIYSRLRDVSSLSGIQYMSNHYREWRVLFSDVYEVGGLDSRRRVDTKTPAFVPPFERVAMHMNDVNFGGGYYEANFMKTGDMLSFGLRNATTLSYFIFPVISEERLRFQIAMIPLREENALLLYGICSVEASDFLQRMVHLPSSFYTRILALKRWFEGRVYG
ncbi:MAG: hypothetical protein HC888_18080 [Candidatus Competibacteraceae bacterium]|nr:hypothetical protein [Candidatus Competibacteraceae bacterium]